MGDGRGGCAERSTPAEAQEPEGPTADCRREGKEATGAHSLLDFDSGQSGIVQSVVEIWECTRHLKRKISQTVDGMEADFF